MHQVIQHLAAVGQIDRVGIRKPAPGTQTDGLQVDQKTVFGRVEGMIPTQEPGIRDAVLVQVQRRVEPPEGPDLVLEGARAQAVVERLDRRPLTKRRREDGDESAGPDEAKHLVEQQVRPAEMLDRVEADRRVERPAPKGSAV
jgi:hypothetical protein